MHRRIRIQCVGQKDPHQSFGNSCRLGRSPTRHQRTTVALLHKILRSLDMSPTKHTPLVHTAMPIDLLIRIVLPHYRRSTLIFYIITVDYLAAGKLSGGHIYFTPCLLFFPDHESRTNYLSSHTSLYHPN